MKYCSYEFAFKLILQLIDYFNRFKPMAFLLFLQKQKEIPSSSARRSGDFGTSQEKRFRSECVAQCDTHARILLLQEPFVHHL